MRSDARIIDHVIWCLGLYGLTKIFPNMFDFPYFILTFIIWIALMWYLAGKEKKEKEHHY